MNFYEHTLEKFDNSLKSKLNCIGLDVLFNIMNDDTLNAWNVTDTTNIVESMLCNVVKITNVAYLILEYFIQTKFDIASKTFYFSHPISYTFKYIQAFKFHTKSITTLDNETGHYMQNCQCKHCLFTEMSVIFGKLHNTFIHFTCKHIKKDNHVEFCRDCCLMVNNGDELSCAIHVHTTREEKLGILKNCTIQTYGGYYNQNCFTPKWEFLYYDGMVTNDDNRKKRRFIHK